jgi:predicted DNA-binding transcriptional regulator YafY
VHASQKLKTERDGSVVAEFHLDDTEEIKRWIMSFGKHATVLEPAELQDEILEEVKGLLERYEMVSHV